MAERKRLYLQGAALASVLVVSAITTDAEDWRPLSLVVAMCALMVLAESVAVETRKIRTSAGMLVQVPIMAILGPGPAVFAGVLAVAVDARVNRVRGEELLLNFLIFSGVGLVGGLAFDGLREALDLDRGDSANALLVLPVYAMLCLLNVAFIVLFLPGRTPAERRRVVRESGVPLIPLELVSAVLASAAVLAWADAGLWAIVGLLVVLLVIIALARTVSSNLRLSDDSDARSAEVARLSSDRERLLSEVLDAEQRERARLAESLHDGPMQRLAAIRQDAAESDSALASHLDVALAETRAIISAFHPATTAQMGLEASLRAAVAPFPASAGITLTVSGNLHDPLLLPLAQELVVNAVKHAEPTRIDVQVTNGDGEIALEVNDDGIGIDESRPRQAVQAGHLGLAMVRRRVEDAGGTLDIATRDDGGTRSRVTLPARNDPLDERTIPRTG